MRFRNTLSNKRSTTGEKRFRKNTGSFFGNKGLSMMKDIFGNCFLSPLPGLFHALIDYQGFAALPLAAAHPWLFSGTASRLICRLLIITSFKTAASHLKRAHKTRLDPLFISSSGMSTLVFLPNRSSQILSGKRKHKFRNPGYELLFNKK
jgi:hypothetical protein